MSDNARLVDGLADLLDTLQLPQIHLYGSSIGGYLAQLFACRHPDRLATLFIGNSFWDPFRSQAKWPALADIQGQPSETLLLRARRKLAEMVVKEPAQAELKAALLAIVGPQQDADSVKARLVSLLSAKPVRRVPLPAARVVVVDSDDDPVISSQQRNELRRRYSASPHHMISGGGHYPSVLRPDTLATVMVTEINRAVGQDSVGLTNTSTS